VFRSPDGDFLTWSAFCKNTQDNASNYEISKVYYSQIFSVPKAIPARTFRMYVDGSVVDDLSRSLRQNRLRAPDFSFLLDSTSLHHRMGYGVSALSFF